MNLTITQAGGAYLDAVCPVNDAWDDLDLAVDQFRLALDGGNSSGAEDRFTEALTALGTKSRTAARTLEDSDQIWPAGAASSVEEVAESLREDFDESVRAAKLDPEDAVALTWPGATESAAAASAVREALGLPAEGREACAERQKELPGSGETSEPAKTPTIDTNRKPGEGATP